MTVFSKVIKLFQKKENFSKNLVGWEIPLSNESKLMSFIETQAYLENSIDHIGCSIKLEFENNTISKITHFDDGVIDNTSTKRDQKKIDKMNSSHMKFEKTEGNLIFQITKKKKGLHQIGGIAPESLTIPTTKNIGKFQYLGYISHEDDYFKWLSFKFYIVCPIYLNFDTLFLDYSNPNKPTIYNKKELNDCDTSYDCINNESYIVYKDYPFGLEGVYGFGNAMGHTGVPNWLQYPNIPRCPKTGKTMKFLCQLNSYGGIMVKETNINPNKKNMKAYFKKLNFAIDGDLYVFVEPSSKMACYIIQNT